MKYPEQVVGYMVVFSLILMMKMIVIIGVHILVDIVEILKRA